MLSKTKLPRTAACAVEPADSTSNGASRPSNKKIRRIIPMFPIREDNGFDGRLRASTEVLRRERHARRHRERRSAGVPAPLLCRGLLHAQPVLDTGAAACALRDGTRLG